MGQLVYLIVLAVALAPVIWGWIVYTRLSGLRHQLAFARAAFQDCAPGRQETARKHYEESAAVYELLRRSISGRLISKIFSMGPAPGL